MLKAMEHMHFRIIFKKTLILFKVIQERDQQNLSNFCHVWSRKTHFYLEYNLIRCDGSHS